MFVGVDGLGGGLLADWRNRRRIMSDHDGGSGGGDAVAAKHASGVTRHEEASTASRNQQ